METATQKDYDALLKKHQQDLQRFKESLDEQNALIDQLEAEYKALNIDFHHQISLEDLPQEYQQQYHNFMREISEVNELLVPTKVKKSAAILKRPRMMV